MEHENAEKDYMAGMKYKDIAKKYGTTINTVKSWKKRYGWERKKGAHKNEKGCTQKIGAPYLKMSPAAGVEYDGTKETLQNTELTAAQQLFCICYSKTFNATQSYLKAYGSSYETAMVNGCMLLRNTKVREEIKRLKEIKRQQIVVGEEDMVELQMRIAFADIGCILEFDEAGVRLNNSGLVDTQLIKSVKEGKFGVAVEVEDRQKAMDWLTKYFLMHQADKYRAEFEKKRAENEAKRAEERNNNIDNILKNMETIAEVLAAPTINRSIEDFEEVQVDEQTGTV